MNTLQAADLYCGAGGASAGLFAAAKRNGIPVHLTAINHWDVAIATHTANFPGQVHLCADVEKVKAKDAVPSGKLDLLLAGPSCVHFSQARGGKPVSDQQRSSAWEVVHWCRDLDVSNVLVENVPEFLTWGPVATDGKPCKERKGMYFREWVKRFEGLGYTVEWRVLNAAHYGDATTRKRLFIQARKGKRIVWPKPSHHSPTEISAYPGAKAWIPARDIIDWALPSQSIYNRKRPLAENTLRRIFAGLNKFCGLPFIAQFTQTRGTGEGGIRGVDQPIPTITTKTEHALCQPFLVVLRRQGGELHPGKSIDDPVPTICAGANHIGLCQPFLVSRYSQTRDTDARVHDLAQPLPTVTAQGGPMLVQPFLTKFFGGHDAASLDEPLPTICANYEHYGLCQPFLVRYNGGPDRNESVENPLTTLDTSNRFGLVQPYLVSFHGNDDAASLDDPLATLRTRDRFGLVTPELREILDKGDEVYVLDIHFRMLQPHELAAAHSFPKDYEFSGGREDKVKQIGNSWPCKLSEALCEGLLQ